MKPAFGYRIEYRGHVVVLSGDTRFSENVIEFSKGADLLIHEVVLAPIHLKPLGDRVLVEPVEEKEVKKGGVIIPDTAKEKPTEGIVRAVGPGKLDEDGKRIPMEVKEGDRVLITKYGGTEIKLNDKDYKIMSSEDVLGLLE